MKIEILFENSDFLVINKPAGIIVHSDGRNAGPFITDWIKERYPEIEGVGEPIYSEDGKVIDRPGIVHRLDKETTGVLVIVKNKKAHKFLKKQFQEHTVRKIYRLFTYGAINEKEGIIDRPIGRSKSDFRRYSAQRGALGEVREAVTEYIVLARKIEGVGIDQRFSYVEALPRTGRTHQIRVHFKAINYPLVSDSLYAPTYPKALGFERVALHALSIEFLGLDGKMIKVEASLPDDFKNALNNFVFI